MKRITTHHPASSRGFTIVELLIVIVVIAILAVITVVAYNGIQDRANAAAIQSDLANMAKKLELARAETDAYPLVPTASLGIKLTKSAYNTTVNNLYYCAEVDKWAVFARGKSGQMFMHSSTSGFSTYTGGWSAATVCEFAGMTFRSGGFDSASQTWQPWTG